jgi:DNA-binding CsgD family transcriptional regulator
MADQRLLAFRDRVSECETLDRLLDAVRGGDSAALVIRGEAGIGKTALMRYCVRQAAGFRVTQIAGVESEMELPFAGLHQICVPLLDWVSSLPEPQQNALRVAFGLASGPAPDRFLVALATLSLLAEVAAQRPLLCVIDDAQWLDDASSQVLTFVARRLRAESVMTLFAARESTSDSRLQGLPRLHLRGLPEQDARALLATVVPGRLDDGVRDRIVAETGGNPLALLELPQTMTAAELAGGFAQPDWRDLTDQLEAHYLRRHQVLPDTSQRLVLLAAADPTGDATLLWRAAQNLGTALEVATPSVTDQFFNIGARVHFHHPLVRSAVYRAAPQQDRQRVHLALAAATDAQVDPDRRAWHLATAANQPDEDVAAELERSAGRAHARGGLAAAAAFLQRAVALTPDPARRAQRALDAAQASLGAGAYDPALRLLAVAEASSLDDLQRGRLQLLHGMVAHAQRRGSDAPPLLLQAAQTLESMDPRFARETYLDAWSAALFAGKLAGAGSLYEVSRAVRRAPPAPTPQRPCDELMDGFALLLTKGRRLGEGLLRQATEGFAADRATVEEVLRWGWLATIGAVVVWDYERCVAIANRTVNLARDVGDLTVLAVALNIETQAVAMSGDYQRAEQLITEADVVTEATGTQVLQYGALYLRGFQGRQHDVARLSDVTMRDAVAGGQGTAIEYVDLAAAVIMNGAGRYRQALARARAAADATPELVVAGWALLEVIEAAARSGATDAGHEALERLAERNQTIDTDWGRGLEARSRALLTDGTGAESHYRESIERLARTPLRPELARSHLVYGEWLRRRQRRTDARHQLRTAHDMLTTIGMDAFAERARHELQATGETVRKRRDNTRTDLTVQEAHIARLARDGRTNPEIGAELYLSARTVEWHLRNVFTKLGITSRRALREALPHGTEPATPA